MSDANEDEIERLRESRNMVEHGESCECRICDLMRIADLRAEIERMREALRQGRDTETYIFTIQKRDAEIADLRAENERLRERAEELTTLCNDRLCQRWDDNTEYRAEIDRLREVLEEIHNFPWIASDVLKIAQEALEGGGDE